MLPRYCVQNKLHRHQKNIGCWLNDVLGEEIQRILLHLSHSWRIVDPLWARLSWLPPAGPHTMGEGCIPPEFYPQTLCHGKSGWPDRFRPSSPNPSYSLPALQWRGGCVPTPHRLTPPRRYQSGSITSDPSPGRPGPSWQCLVARLSFPRSTPQYVVGWKLPDGLQNILSAEAKQNRAINLRHGPTALHY